MIHLYIWHNIAFRTIVIDLKVYMLLLFDKQYRKGRYTNTANLLRKYFGDFLIATYLNAVQESRYDDGYISEIEVRFSFEFVHKVCLVINLTQAISMFLWTLEEILFSLHEILLIV
jgi:hypothetical protein